MNNVDGFVDIPAIVFPPPEQIQGKLDIFSIIVIEELIRWNISWWYFGSLNENAHTPATVLPFSLSFGGEEL